MGKAERAHATKLMKARLSQSNAGKRVAMGCTSLLKAQSNGKMEWFENQAWYRKALKMCTSISDRNVAKMEMATEIKRTSSGTWEIAKRNRTEIKNKTARSRMSAFRQYSPVDLMQGTCAKLLSV